MNNEINSIILGATEITSGGSGGSEARANIHQIQSNHKTAADIRFIKNNINNVLIPKLIKLGVMPSGLKFKFDFNEVLSMQDRIKIDQILLGSYKLSKEYIERTYGVELEEVKSNEVESINEVEPKTVAEDIMEDKTEDSTEVITQDNNEDNKSEDVTNEE